MNKLVTIGGYGYTEAAFLSALEDAKVDTFVDIRQRRGMRGAKYAFLNSEHLQTLLARTGIRYFHAKELAPTTEVRAMQKEADRSNEISKHSRSQLASEFVEAYRQQILSKVDARRFASLVGPSASVVALFCVEGQPQACHRSLVAQKYAADLNVPCENILARSPS